MQADITVEKRLKRAGATPLFWLPAAQKVLGVAPALDALRAGLFSTVQSRNKVSCTLYSNSRAEKETAHGGPKGTVQPAKEWSPPCR